MSASKPAFLGSNVNRAILPSNKTWRTHGIQVRHLKWVPPKKRGSTKVPDKNAVDAESERLVQQYQKALLIDPNGINMGVVPLGATWEKLKQPNLSLILVRDSDPPVIRVDQKLSSRDEKIIQKRKDSDPETLHERIKEVRITDRITEHDLQVKVAKITQLLLTKHKVRITMSYKKKAEFDAQVAKVMLDNVLARLTEICIVEGAVSAIDDRACGVTIRPISRAQLISKGLIEPPSTEERGPTRKEIIAERRRQDQIRYEELKAQGLIVKKYLSPEEQSKLYAEQLAKGLIKQPKKHQSYDDDEYRQYEDDDDDPRWN
jgi:translation initiation factor IF-3